MSSSLLNALIGAAGTIFGALIGVFVKLFFEDGARYRISKDRRAALTGKWEGRIANLEVPDDSPSLFSAHMSCTFVAYRKKVKGSGRFELQGTTYQLTLKGYLSDQKYVHLEYTHSTPVYAFGYMLLTLSNHGTSMAGKAVGYGAFSGKIIVGTVELKKRA